jgi:hypothetical protein
MLSISLSFTSILDLYKAAYFGEHLRKIIMNSQINKLSLLLLCLAITATAFSQNYLKSPQAVENELKYDLDYLFQPLDKSRITSGLLSNYALELAEVAPYNGVLSDTYYTNQLFISKISIV